MNRSITLGSESKLTDLILLLLAALVKILFLSIEFLFLLVAAFFIKMHRDQTGAFGLAFLLVISLFVFNLVAVLGYL